MNLVTLGINPATIGGGKMEPLWAIFLAEARSGGDGGLALQAASSGPRKAIGWRRLVAPRIATSWAVLAWRAGRLRAAFRGRSNQLGQPPHSGETR